MEPPPPGATKSDKKKKTKRMPSPQELVSHYENQGMESHAASLKVIQDLQGALFRVVTSAPPNNSAKLHSHLLRLETKVDSKPGYPQAVALGVASAGVWNAAVGIWGFVRRATSSSGPS